MTAHEVELGIVEPAPVDPRAEQVTALLILKLEQGDPYDETAAAVVAMLDALDEDDDPEDDGGFDVDLALLRGGTAAYGVMLLAWVAGFVLAVVAVWTPDPAGTRLAATAALTFLFGVLSGMVGRAAAKALPDAVEDPS